jgi:hypothetical protein
VVVASARCAPGERNGEVVELSPTVMALVIAGLDAITCFNRAIEEGGLRGELLECGGGGWIDARE